eukprot:10077724-Alexandrium_andersonii.AAC.1
MDEAWHSHAKYGWNAWKHGSDGWNGWDGWQWGSDWQQNGDYQHVKSYAQMYYSGNKDPEKPSCPPVPA